VTLGHQPRAYVGPTRACTAWRSMVLVPYRWRAPGWRARVTRAGLAHLIAD